MKELEVIFNLADSAYMTALRLVAGAVCSLHDVDIDASEDFKVCVTESAIILKDCGFEKVRVTFHGDSAACTIVGEGGNPHPSGNEFSLALISALVGECDIKERGGITERVTLKV